MRLHTRESLLPCILFVSTVSASKIQIHGDSALPHPLFYLSIWPSCIYFHYRSDDLVRRNILLRLINASISRLVFPNCFMLRRFTRAASNKQACRLLTIYYLYSAYSCNWEIVATLRTVSPESYSVHSPLLWCASFYTVAKQSDVQRKIHWLVFPVFPNKCRDVTKTRQ